MKAVRTIGIVNSESDATELNPICALSLGTRFGVAATDLVAQQQFRRLVALKAGKIEAVSLDEALEKMKFIDPCSEIVHSVRAVGATFGDSA